MSKRKTESKSVKAAATVAGGLVFFQTLTAKQYAAKQGYYCGAKGAQEIQNFWTFAANAIMRTLDTGDVTHVNKLLEGSKNVGRYRAFARVCQPVIPFTLKGKGGTFDPKSYDREKRDRLVAPMEKDGKTAPKWEHLMQEYISKEADFSKTTPANTWEVDKAVLRLVKKAKTEGYTIDEVIDEVRKQGSKVA